MRIILAMNPTPGAESFTRLVDLQSNLIPLCYGCPVQNIKQHQKTSATTQIELSFSAVAPNLDVLFNAHRQYAGKQQVHIIIQIVIKLYLFLCYAN